MQKLSLKHIPVPDLYQRLYGFFSSALQIELPNLNLSDVTFLPVMKKKIKTDLINWIQIKIITKRYTLAEKQNQYSV